MVGELLFTFSYSVKIISALSTIHHLTSKSRTLPLLAASWCFFWPLLLVDSLSKYLRVKCLVWWHLKQLEQVLAVFAGACDWWKQCFSSSLLLCCCNLSPVEDKRCLGWRGPDWTERTKSPAPTSWNTTYLVTLVKCKFYESSKADFIFRNLFILPLKILSVALGVRYANKLHSDKTLLTHIQWKQDA